MSIIVKEKAYRRVSLKIMPNAPALNCHLSDQKKIAKIPIFALIDSGADITGVKRQKIKELQKKLGFSLPRQLVFDIDDRLSAPAITYVCGIEMGNKFSYIPQYGVLCPPENRFGLENVWIGRDIQKELIIILNGPNQTFTIEDPKRS